MHTMKLEIQFLSGDSEVRPLDPDQSISIGRADSCDVRVDEEDEGFVTGDTLYLLQEGTSPCGGSTTTRCSRSSQLAKGVVQH